MGIRGSATAELIMENCIVPRENLLGKEGQGFKIAMATLDGGRIGIAAQALGIAEGAFHETVAYVKERKRLANRSQIPKYAIRARGPEGAHRCGTAARLPCGDCQGYDGPLLRRVGDRKARCGGNGDGSNYQMRAADGRLWIYAGISCGRMMRDAKITEIYEGTSEVQRMVISGAVLK